jgi:hypothetical protein
MYSREYVAHHKTIKHDINNVHHETILYAQPKPKVINEFTFSSIPPKNKLYSSVCSAKSTKSASQYITSVELSPKRRIQRNAQANAQRIK